MLGLLGLFNIALGITYEAIEFDPDQPEVTEQSKSEIKTENLYGDESDRRNFKVSSEKIKVNFN